LTTVSRIEYFLLPGPYFSTLLTEHGCDEDLKKHLNRKSFEQAIIEATTGMEPQYETFIKQLYRSNQENKGITGKLEKGHTAALSEPQQPQNHER